MPRRHKSTLNKTHLKAIKPWKWQRVQIHTHARNTLAAGYVRSLPTSNMSYTWNYHHSNATTLAENKFCEMLSFRIYKKGIFKIWINLNSARQKTNKNWNNFKSWAQNWCFHEQIRNNFIQSKYPEILCSRRPCIFNGSCEGRTIPLTNPTWVIEKCDRDKTTTPWLFR